MSELLLSISGRWAEQQKNKEGKGRKSTTSKRGSKSEWDVASIKAKGNIIIITAILVVGSLFS